jgi:YD repeat-containing protein
MNRRLTETSGAGETTRIAYDPAGNLVERTNPGGEKTAFSYDGLDRLIAIDDPLRGRSKFVHDENGKMATSPRPSTAPAGRRPSSTTG